MSRSKRKFHVRTRLTTEKNLPMRKMLKIGLLVLCVTSLVGCESKKGGLATEYGTMTLEEFEAIQAKQQKEQDAALEAGNDG